MPIAVVALLFSNAVHRTVDVVPRIDVSKAPVTCASRRLTLWAHEDVPRRRRLLHGQRDDSLFNFAVNDEMLLHQARESSLRSGDVVEIIPTISGGLA